MPITLTPTNMSLSSLRPDEEDRFQASYGRDILVVDDHQTNLIAVEAALAPLGRRLVLAHSGTEALARLLEKDFALIILDVEMPGMDGFALTKHVRDNPLTAHIPVIMITAADDRHRDDARRAGVSKLLGKPYPEQELIDTIRNAMQARVSSAGAIHS